MTKINNKHEVANWVESKVDGTWGHKTQEN